MAEPATPPAIARIDKELQRRKKEEQERLLQAKTLAQILERDGITIHRRAPPSGKLYAQISAEQVRDIVSAKLGQRVELDATPIARLGERELTLTLHPRLPPVDFIFHVKRGTS